MMLKTLCRNITQYNNNNNNNNKGLPAASTEYRSPNDNGSLGELLALLCIGKPQKNKPI